MTLSGWQRALLVYAVFTGLGCGMNAEAHYRRVTMEVMFKSLDVIEQTPRGGQLLPWQKLAFAANHETSKQNFKTSLLLFLKTWLTALVLALVVIGTARYVIGDFKSKAGAQPPQDHP